MLRKNPELPDDNSPLQPPSKRNTWITIVFAVIILVPSMIGFVMKFIEFVRTFQDDAQGAFAITPMVNYLFASLGFLCMLIWAIVNGAFSDMESPKVIMLERERMLDRDQALQEKGSYVH